MFNPELPCLSIGEMIEFLDERGELDFKIWADTHISTKKTREWKVATYVGVAKDYIAKELADALWEGVKEELGGGEENG